MDEELKKIYQGLSAKDQEQLRQALRENDLIKINAYKKAANLPIDKEALPVKEKRGAGRPNYGLKKLDVQRIQQKNKQFTTLNNIERLEGEEIEGESLEDFRARYAKIINETCIDFYDKHEDLVKKSPFIWYNSLLFEIKKKLPHISVLDAQRVEIAWDAFTELMFKIGLFPTMEAFTCLTGVYKQELYRQLTPAHVALKTKIYNDCRDNMTAQVSYNPMTQVNKMFLLKSVYGFKESSDAPVIEADQGKRTLDEIPKFNDDAT